MSKKKPTFPARPCPPAGVDIVNDVSKATNSDILFQLDENTSTENVPGNKSTPMSSLMVESFTSQDEIPFSPDPVSENPQDELAHQMNAAAIDNVYKQASQFLQVSETLQDAPQTLKEQCRHLEHLGAELQQSIDALKAQTQFVIKESVFNSGVK